MTAIPVDGPADEPARFVCVPSLALVALAALVAVAAVAATADPARALMARGDYLRAVRDIEAGTRLALANCRGLADTARTVCRANARGQDRVARAELEARYLGTVESQAHARLARARSEYDLARAMCLARAHDARKGCVAAAKAERSRAMAQARAAI
jgi:hypothetical protein